MENSMELLSISKAAKLLKISRESVNLLIDKGAIKTIKIKKRIKIPYSELLNFIENMSEKKTTIINNNSGSVYAPAVIFQNIFGV